MSVFDRIYAQNRWNGRISLSGPGSDPNATKRIAAILPEIVANLGISTVVNAGCGDDIWTPDLPVFYVGLDVVPLAIARARRRHPDRTYSVADIRDGIPAADLVLCRDVLQHLPAYDVERVIERIRASGSTWLLASTYSAPSDRHIPESPVGTIAPGGYWCPDLTVARFGLGQPVANWPDGFDYERPDEIADPHKWLGLWRLSPAS